jgi:putative hydrolase of the HAD superfamily
LTRRAENPYGGTPQTMASTSFVFFDIGLTLLDSRGPAAYHQVLQDLGFEVSLAEVERAFHLEDKRFMREFPGVIGNPDYSPMPWFLGGANWRLGVKTDLCEASSRWRELQRQVQPYWLPFPGVAGVLQELRSRGLGLGVISNWDPGARGLLEYHGLARFFDPIVISSEVGAQKPQAEIFRIALGKAAVRGEQCLYVGDNYYDDVLGCRKVGMRGLLVSRFGRLGLEEVSDCPILTALGELPAFLDDHPGG